MVVRGKQPLYYKSTRQRKSAANPCVDETYTGTLYPLQHPGAGYLAPLGNIPPILSSLVPLTESPEETGFFMDGVDPFDHRQSRFSAGPEMRYTPCFSLDHAATGRKRPFEGDPADDSSSQRLDQPFMDVFSTHSLEATPVARVNGPYRSQIFMEMAPKDGKWKSASFSALKEFRNPEFAVYEDAQR